MKKTLLILSMALGALTVNAQTQRTSATRVDNAQNLPTSGLNEGFEFKFLGGRQDNCLSLVIPGTNDHYGDLFGPNGGTGQGGFTNGFSVNLDSTNHRLLVAANGASGSLFGARLPKGDCSSYQGGSTDALNMTGTKKISITLTSDVAIPHFLLFPAVLNGTSFEYVDGDATDPVIPQAVAANTPVTLTFHISTKKYNGLTMDITKGIGFGMAIKDVSDVAIAANLVISSVKIGDAVTTSVPTANQNANVVNDQVALFPNPAKGSFHVDVTAMNNSDAVSVKVMNANGLVVKEFSSNLSDIEIATEGMNKGIYMVQVTSGNKIATKKVVVE